MKKSLVLIIILFSAITICYSQELQQKEVDAEVVKFLEAGDTISAINVLNRIVNKEIDNNNLDTAFKYQLTKCRLIDKCLETLSQNGFTFEDYFDNYSLAWILERETGNVEGAIIDYLTFARLIKKYVPYLLPKYCETMAGTMARCQTAGLVDSIYCLQDALDVLKIQEVNNENVNYYVWFNQCYNMNRFYKSVEHNIFIYNGFTEAEQWFDKNKKYINSLDKTLYKDQILEYYIDYTDMLYMYAGILSVQLQRPQEAIEKYNQIIKIIEPLLPLNDTLSQKIAGCNAEIARCYFTLGDINKSKVYSELSLKYLSHHKNDWDYVTILEALANNYYVNGQRNKAALLQLKMFTTKRFIGIEPSISDYSGLFMYLVDQDPQSVINMHSSFLHSTESDSDFYYNAFVGHAFSLLSKNAIVYNDSALYYLNRAERILLIDSNKYAKDNTISDRHLILYKYYCEHYLCKGDFENAYKYAVKANSYPGNERETYQLSLIAAHTNRTVDLQKALPIFYYDFEKDMIGRMTVMGSAESDQLLGQGRSELFHIPEWVSWNPTDTVSLSVGYDAALLMKKLTLRFNNISSVIAQDASIGKEKTELDNLRDSIYTIEDENERMLALHDYQVAESKILDKAIPDTLHWRDVKKMLCENESCIEFVKYYTNTNPWERGEPKLHYAALILSKAKEYPSFVDLFDEDELLEVYNLQPKSYKSDSGNSLYKKLWGKINPYITSSSATYFSPTGTLNLIGIEFLSDSDNVTASERYNLRRVSSTMQIANVKSEKNIDRIVAFGGIDYKKPSTNRSILDSIITRGDWDYLDNTVTEVENISNTMGSKKNTISVFSGNKATENAFKQLDGTDANIIHIASHGFFVQPSKRNLENYYSKSAYTKAIQDELFYSGLVLSGGQESWKDSVYHINGKDGILTSYEISKLDLHNVDLVVLSACETGIGDNNYDGVYGLQLAFKKAGVKSIMMSLWKVDDKVTAEYMSTFYDLLSKGNSIYESYQKSIRHIQAKYPDPLYWAAFVLLD